MFNVIYEKAHSDYTAVTLGGTYTFKNAININTNRRYGIRVDKIVMSNSIPNIFDGTINGTPVNTRYIRISNDDFATHTDIILDIGNYSVAQIQNAINAVAGSWYKDTNDPAFTMNINEALKKIYISIDSTKLYLGTQFAIDFGESPSGLSSDIWKVLGIGSGQTKSFNTDGIHTFTGIPRINYFGDAAYIEIIGIGSLGYKSGLSSFVIASVDFTGTDTNKWITVNQSQLFTPCEMPSLFKTFDVRVVSRDGEEILAYGDAYITVFITFMAL
jgi:hypothetical protein